MDESFCRGTYNNGNESQDRCELIENNPPNTDGDLLNVSTFRIVSTKERGRQHARVPSHWISITRVSFNDIDIAVKDVLKLHALNEWLEVREIYRDPSAYREYAILGVRLVPSARLHGSFEELAHEVVAIEEVFTDSHNCADGAHLQRFTLQHVLPVVKITVHHTNIPLSGMACGQDVQERLRQFAEQGNVLICRSKYIAHFNKPSTRKNARIRSDEWSNLRESEVPSPENRVEDYHIRLQGKFLRSTRTEFQKSRIPGKYVFVDLFCGAGFASEGAKAAGLQVLMACDRDARALRSYMKNHPDTEVIHGDFKSFVEVIGEQLNVDVLHISFPCPFFARCKTVPGPKDDENEVAMLGIGYILEKIKPRLVSIEQADGIEVARFRDHLMSVVALMRGQGYSVKKTVVDSPLLGCNSERKRLIICGAAPGEYLPDFPEYTHYRNAADARPGMKPVVIALDALRDVDPDHPDHAVQYRMELPPDQHHPATDPLRPLRCKTTSRVVHWTGTRLCSPREEMNIISAPSHYVLAEDLGVTIKSMQIGNAFPPVVAEKVFRELIKTLDRTKAEDERIARTERERGQILDLEMDVDIQSYGGATFRPSTTTPSTWDGITFGGYID